eukprot:6475903-Amphidinium_carterae.2
MSGMSNQGDPRSCDVCILGLGVSSLPLIVELKSSDVDYLVVSEGEFGVWAKLHDLGESFDLVTTIESTNYSWWSYEYNFPFYTARQYYSKLRQEIDDSI